jgi:hypothetical protein
MVPSVPSWRLSTASSPVPLPRLGDQCLRQAGLLALPVDQPRIHGAINASIILADQEETSQPSGV